MLIETKRLILRSMDEKDLDGMFRIFLDKKVQNITNSNGLKRKVEQLGGKAKVAHQGVDVDSWIDFDLRKNSSKTVIGCLKQKKPTKRWKYFKKLSEILGHDAFEYIAFGSESCTDSFLDDYIESPTSYLDLSNIYSRCHKDIN